jgi:transposase-like protein
MTDKTNLNKPIFQTPEKAREFLESVRWPDGPICPHCGSVSKEHYELQGDAHRAGLWKCRDCREQFTVTVGTVFERSHIALNVWLQAAYLMCSSKKGISAKQLERTLGVTYRTAWFMCHRIREAMREGGVGFLGGGGIPVEVDETYWGNKQPKGSFKKFGSRGAGGHHKMKVVSLVERGGRARSFQLPTVYGGTLREVLRQHIAPGATIHTDESSIYGSLRVRFNHQTVNHRRGEYVRGNVTTNTVEGYFSILKRGLIGTFHHVGEQHLHRYVNEFDFRYNTREKLGYNDFDRMQLALKQIAGKRLTYR